MAAASDHSNNNKDASFESAHLPALVWARELGQRQAKNPLYLPRSLSYRRESSGQKKRRWDGQIARRICFRVDKKATLSLYKRKGDKLQCLDCKTVEGEATFDLVDADDLCVQVGCKKAAKIAGLVQKEDALSAHGATHGVVLPLSDYFLTTDFFDRDTPGARGEEVKVKLGSLSSSSSVQIKIRAFLLAASSSENDEEVSSQEKTTTYFHLLFRNDGGKLESRVERRADGKCPWCDLSYGDSAGALLAHLQAHHSPSLKFQAVRKDDVVHVLALPRELQGEREEREEEEDSDSIRHDSELPEVPAVTDELSLRRALADKSVLNAPPSKKRASRPALPRQYYHARTSAPIQGDIFDTPDSDDDVDEDWRLEVSNQLLDEFDDVTLHEKRFMKLWNAYVFKHPIRADRLLPDSCLCFAKMHADQLVADNLRHNFLLHLLHLWDNSLLNANHIANCLRQVDHRASEEKN